MTAPAITTDALMSRVVPAAVQTIAGPAVQADLFCRVVDNYGDIGVCWRLARRLGEGHGWRVRLWVDDLASFARIEPAVDAARDWQQVAMPDAAVEVLRWSAAVPDVTPGDVVIEAFGCDPPSAFIARMRPDKQIWINLEYLSAEPWVESCHGLPSLQPGGVHKYFFFPGFTPHTGGLLREPALTAERDAWRADPARRDALLARLGLSDAARALLRSGARLCTVFCYADAPVQTLCAALSQTGSAVLLMPQGVLPDLAEGMHGRAQIVRIPFVSQTDFDRLLWSADLNLVRGEDSFVRALWAGRPMLWHIYPQQDDAHLAKLDAWLARYDAPLAVAALLRAWNTAGPGDADSCPTLTDALTSALAPPHWQSWRTHADAWSRAAADQPDLADALVNFALARLAIMAR